MKYSPLPMIPLLSLTLTIFIVLPLCSLANNERPSKVTYHNGPILTGEVNLSVVWFGKVKEEQKNNLRLFVKSLNTEQNISFEPRVTNWWRRVESYQLVADKKLREVPKIKVRVVNEIDELGKTNLRDVDFDDVVKKGAVNNSIVVVIVAENAEWESATSRCFLHKFDGKSDGKQLIIVVNNPIGEMKKDCGWPFFSDGSGNVGFLVPAPHGEEYADLMVGHFASALVGTVTNPQGSGFSSAVGSDDKEEEDALEAASMCRGVFGTGAFPGYAGRLRIDPHTGGGFNAHGLNETKFLLPAIWDPKKGHCWTTL